MLVTDRKVNQSLFLTVPPSTEPTVIEVICVANRRGGIRLGIDAPKVVKILRDELVDKAGAA